MNYEDFLAYVKRELKSYLDMENSRCAVNVRKVLKNNGIELDALTIVDVECKTSPTIYLNRYYDEYVKGRAAEEIVKEILELFRKNYDRINFDINEFTDFFKMKDKIAYKVVSVKKNGKLLKKVPHVKKMDLAIIFYCIIRCNKDENATTLIYNQHLELWDVSPEDVYEAALENTPKILPYEIKSMGDIIKEMLEEGSEDEEVCEDGFYGDVQTEILADKLMEELSGDSEIPQMFVLTNIFRLNGAAAMFYEGVLKKFAEEKQSDLIILPSSVHEVILIPVEQGMKTADFKPMIKEVNEEEVDPSEILSDHAYLYRRAEDEIVV